MSVEQDDQPKRRSYTMNTLITYESDVEILRAAEQARGEAMGAFFRWLFTKPAHAESEYTQDGVAAE